MSSSAELQKLQTALANQLQHAQSLNRSTKVVAPVSKSENADGIPDEFIYKQITEMKQRISSDIYLSDVSSIQIPNVLVEQIQKNPNSSIRIEVNFVVEIDL